MQQVQTQIEDVMRACPSVRRILREAEAEAKHGGNKYVAYERLKKRAARVVGFKARKEELRDPAVYEAVVRAITKALGV